MPTFYECQRCAACCRWPGQVRLLPGEIARLARFKGMSEYDFIQEFTRLTSDRRGLALTDKPTGECIFLEDGNCAVQDAKPQQCSDFPNLWRFPGFEKTCHSIPKSVGRDEYVRLVAKATRRSERDVAEFLASQNVTDAP